MLTTLFIRKQRFLSLLFMLFTTSIFAQVQIKFDNPKRNYIVGENITFRITSSSYGTGNYELSYDPNNPSAVIKKGTFTAGPGQDAYVSFSLNQPNMVFIKAIQNGYDLKSLAIDPLSIKPIETEPADFDAFWQLQKSKLAAIPMNPQLIEINTLSTGAKVYRIQLDQIDNRKVYGYLCVPAGGGQFPAVLTLPPYGTSPQQIDALMLTDFAEKSNAISLLISVHNAPPDQVDPNAYMPDNLDQKEGYYARYMILGSLRAIDYLASRSDCNGSIGVSGISQGGGLSVFVAGLDSRISALMAISPSEMEQDGWRYNKASGFPNFAKSGTSLNLDTNAVFKYMRYYDGENFLKRFKGVVMCQSGYQDEVSPAATQLAGYNLHRGKSFFLHMLNHGHEYPFNEYFLGRYAFFAQYLKGFKKQSNFALDLDIDAGSDKNINTNSTNLVGSIVINSGANLASNIRWAKIDGPGTVSFSNINSLTTTAQFSQPGTYTLKLSADYDYLVNDPSDAFYYSLNDYITINYQTGGSTCDNDATPPIFTNCPQNITVATQGISASAIWAEPLVTDNCGTPVVNISYSPGAYFPVGTTPVTYTAIDTKGNRSTCTFNVTVSTTILPPTNNTFCVSKSGTPWEVWLANVTFNTINNFSDKFKDYSTLGYSDFTNLSTTVNKGQTYPLSIIPGVSWFGILPSVFCRVWIDFNNDKIFEDSERVLEQTNLSPMTANVLIPSSATSGNVRMRVAMKSGGYPSACEVFEKGEVEDYTINLYGIDPCATDITPPVFSACPQNISLTTASSTAIANWTAPTATDNCTTTPSVTSNLPNGSAFPIGTTAVIYTAKDDRGNASICRFNVIVSQQPSTSSDIALGINANPAVFKAYTPLTFTITATNIGQQAFSNLKIEFKYPTETVNGGSATPSVGTWQEWCSGGVPCFIWTIPTLAANSTVTLNVPLYVLNPTSPIVATTTLLSSTPLDNNTANNVASISVLSASATGTALFSARSTQFIPVIVQQVSPNPTSGDMVLNLESLRDEKELKFDFSDTFGKIIKSETRSVTKGANRLIFEVWDFPQGMYFITPSTQMGRTEPVKFVKM